MSALQSPLLDFLTYIPETGMFTWVKSPNYNVPAGAAAGWKNTAGYLCVRFRNKDYVLHRLAWLFVHGEWPVERIDHINGQPTDNRIANLRLASSALNAQNQRKAHRHNRLGVLGVTQRGAKFSACIRVSGKTIHLGRYATAEAAHAAYVKAKREMHEGCTL